MSTIPEFPIFKNIELSDETEIKQFINICKFPPYADYNFINIWTWDINSKMMVSKLNTNLIVIFNDYVTNKQFLSFFGKNLIPETVAMLIDYSVSNFQINELKLLPEEISSELAKSEYKITRDRDSCDYIYSVKDLANMNNWPKSDNHYKSVNKFINLNPDYRIECSCINDVDKNKFFVMFKKWSENKEIVNHFDLNEYKSFERLFEINDENTRIISLYIGNILLGFTVFEILPNEYAVAHFSKADIKLHQGIYDILIWEEAKYLNNLRIKYYDFEQDLGIPGIRFSKESFKPVFMLNKFTVSR